MRHGDLGGDFNAPTVFALKGINIVGEPANGNALIFNGTSLVYATPAGGGGTVTAISSPNANITITNPTTTPVIDFSSSPIFTTVTLNNPGDVTMLVKSTAAGTSNGAYYVLDSTSTQFGNIQGKVNGGLKWMIGRAGQSHTSGIHFYTNIATDAFFLGDDQSATFKGDAIHSAGKNVTLSGAGLLTTPNLRLNTSAAPSVGQVWTATDTAGNGSWQTVTSGGAGVSTVSVATANGFSGTVATPTTTPVITVRTSVTGLVKGDGTALSAAAAGTDYVIPSGNVATATALATARTINGVSFNGTANITVTDRLTQTATQTADYTAAPGDLVITDATTLSTIVTLPSAPADKTKVAVKRLDSVLTNTVTILCGGTDTFTTSGGTSFALSLTGQTTTLQYNAATTKWTSISNDLPLGQTDLRYVALTGTQTINGLKTFSTDLTVLNTTLDAGFLVKTSGSSKGAYVSVDSTSASANGVLGKVNGSLRWIAGRSSSDTTGYHIYTNIAVHAFGIDDSQVATFYGDVTMTNAKNLIIGTGTGSKIGTSTTQKIGFWNATPVVQQTGNVMTALVTTGLMASPTLAESDITNLVTDLAAKAALASPALTGTPTAPTAANGTNTTQIATTAFVLANGSSGTSLTGMLKGNGTNIVVATAGTDYLSPTGTATVTNKRITKRFVAVTQSATPTINTDTTDIASITGLAQAITNVTVSGTPVAGDPLIVEITDDGTGRAIAWGTSFESSTITLPPTTVAGVKLTVGFMWNAVTSKWRCVGVA